MSAGYQGHLADGSSVQKHSAGGLYPYVLFAKQVGEKLQYGVLSPSGREDMFVTYDTALGFGMYLKENDTLYKELTA